MLGRRGKMRPPDSAASKSSADPLDSLLKGHKLELDDAVRLRELLGRFTEDDAAYLFAWQSWARQLAESLGKASGNQFATTSFALANLFFVVPLPLLTGLSALVGPHASWLRWVTFALTLGAALISRYVADRAYGPRWVLYRRYSESLFEEGQLYVERAGPYDPTQSTPALDDITVKNLFVTRVTELQNNKTNQYNQIVVLASAGGVNGGAKN